MALLNYISLIVFFLLQANSEDLTSGMDSNFKTLNRSFCEYKVTKMENEGEVSILVVCTCTGRDREKLHYSCVYKGNVMECPTIFDEYQEHNFAEQLMIKFEGTCIIS